VTTHTHLSVASLCSGSYLCLLWYLHLSPPGYNSSNFTTCASCNFVSQSSSQKSCVSRQEACCRRRTYLPLDQEVERCMSRLRDKPDDLKKYIYLRNIRGECAMPESMVLRFLVVLWGVQSILEIERSYIMYSFRTPC